MSENAVIKDFRNKSGTPVKEMAPGTWFSYGDILYLKAGRDCFVTIQTGIRCAFGDDAKGQPVNVSVAIESNA